MARPDRIDRDALHRLLWRSRNQRTGSVTFKNQEMADYTGISVYTFSRIMAEFQRDGRLRCVRTGRHSVKIYEVADPAAWESLSG